MNMLTNKLIRIWKFRVVQFQRPETTMTRTNTEISSGNQENDDDLVEIVIGRRKEEEDYNERFAKCPTRTAHTMPLAQIVTTTPNILSSCTDVSLPIRPANNGYLLCKQDTFLPESIKEDHVYCGPSSNESYDQTNL